MTIVSIITPFFNAEKYLEDSIRSVINQNYSNWELLLINDGSTDRSSKIAKSFDDERIQYFEQPNKGVSAARNIGLRSMKGDCFCFLDADDTLTKNSIEVRLNHFFENPKVNFVDGIVIKKDIRMQKELERWVPNIVGNPLYDLVSLEGKSFFGPSWMVKRDFDAEYQMKEGLTHGEDLLFYVELATSNKLYSFVKEVILEHRVHNDSAMNNLEKLESGYKIIYNEIKSNSNIPKGLLRKYRFESKLIMFKSYLSKRSVIKALKAIL